MTSMQIEYRMDYQNKYMVLSGSSLPEQDSYPVRILTENRIPGFLPCRTEEMDMSLSFLYSVSGLLSLRSVLETGKLDFRLTELLLCALADGIETLERYLLPADDLLFSMDCIYLDAGRKRVWLTCFPQPEETLAAGMKAASEDFLTHLDHDDRAAVVTGYAFYRLCAAGEATADSIRRMLQKNGRPEESGQPSGTDSADRTDYAERPFFSERVGSAHGKEPFLRDDPGAGDDWLFPDERKERKSPERKHRLRKAPGKAGILAGLSAAAAGYGCLLLCYMEKPAALIPAGVSLVCALGFMAAFVRYVLLRKKQQANGYEPDSSESPDEDADCPGNREQASDIWGEREDHTMLLPAGGADSFIREEPYRAVLRPAEGRGGPSLFLRKDRYILGKSRQAADFAINAPTVSRVHARLQWENSSYSLTDLHSRNGSRIDGERLLPDMPRLLKAGDVVSFADVRFRYEMAGGVSPEGDAFSHR